MGHSSFGGGSLKRASSCNSAARCLHGFLCFGQWFRWHVGLQYLTSIHDLHALRLMPSPFSSVPQLAQLIDCIVNVVCHVRECGIPPCGAEARSEYVAAGERSGVVLWRGREGSQRVWENSPPVRKRREERGERGAEFDFGGNNVSADRGLASTPQQQSNKAWMH